MNSSSKYFLPLLFSVTLIIGMLIGYKVSREIRHPSEFFIAAKKNSFDELVYLINNQYVDTVNLENITAEKTAELVKSLDPHSTYILPQFVEQINEEFDGKFEGIGIEYTFLKDTPLVLRVLPEGPSEKAGLQVGDQLLAVDTQTLLHQSNIKPYIKGPRGTKIQLHILRNQEKKSLTIVRDIIPLKSVPIYTMLDSVTGYIKLDKFVGSTAKEFIAALQNLKSQNCKHLILDLRDNGGGLLEEAVEIADELLSDDKLIVYTKGLHSKEKQYRCRRKGLFEEGQLTVLMNKYSASASEVVAGALQDWDRATIVGENSFGKGLVQEQFQLKNGAMVRITVAKYYTPSGRCIQKQYSRNENGIPSYVPLNHADSAKILLDTFKTQQGKIIFGSNGIQADIQVKEEQDTLTNALRHSFAIQNYAYTFFNEHRKTLVLYKNADTFFHHFNVNTKQIEAFLTSFQHTINQQQFVDLKKRTHSINQLIKERLADLLFSPQGVFRATYQSDKNILEAFKLNSKVK